MIRPELNIIVCVDSRKCLWAESYGRSGEDLLTGLRRTVHEEGLEEAVQVTPCFCIFGGKHPVQSNFPVLAGQQKEYLIRQFKDIRDGARNNSVTAIMRAIVQDVTDREIALIAGYLSSQ